MWACSGNSCSAWVAGLDLLPLLSLRFAVFGKSRSQSPSLSDSDSELDSDSDNEEDKVGWTVCVLNIATSFNCIDWNHSTEMEAR